MFDVAWDLVKTPFFLFLVVLLIGGTGYVAYTEIQFSKIRRGHNDRDFACRFWWGDRSGSAIGVMNERCLICNPKEPHRG